MDRYMKQHEDFVRGQLAGDSADWGALAEHHAVRIGRMQHERLIHLLVTLFIGLCALITLLALTLRPSVPLAVLLLLFVCLVVPYVLHYFRLENGVQRWYDLADEIEKRADAEAALPGSEQ